MTGKKMYANRYKHMVRACQYLQDNPDAGNTEIGNAIGVSRQAANRIMQDAVARGWVSIRWITWRSNTEAKRYRIARYPFAKRS